MMGDMFIITAMREAKEKQLERRNASVKRNMPAGTVRPLTPVPDSKTGEQGFLHPIPNI